MGAGGTVESIVVFLMKGGWKCLAEIWSEEELDAFVFDSNGIDSYVKDPSSPQHIVKLLKRMRKLEEEECVFQ